MLVIDFIHKEEIVVFHDFNNQVIVVFTRKKNKQAFSKITAVFTLDKSSIIKSIISNSLLYKML